MRRIAVLGSPGSGKSTLARELGSILGLKVYHMDALYWKPGGVPTTDEERDAILREVIDRERWVFDGNDRRTLDRRLAAADTVIFLDFPTVVCTWRTIWRATVGRNRPAPDLASGSRPYINAKVLRWLLTFRRDYRPDILDALSRHARGRRIIVLRSSSEVEEFLAGLKDRGRLPQNAT